MSARRQGYNGHLLTAAIIHGVLIGSILVVALFKGCNRPSDITMPMELIIEAPSDMDEDTDKPEKEEVKTPEPEPEPDKDDIPEPDKKPEKKPEVRKPEVKKEVKKPAKTKVEVSKKLVVRNRKSKTKLSSAEVQRLLDRGGKIGNKASLSDADLRRLLNSDTRFGNGNPATQELVYMDVIKQAMYRAWDQPTSLGVAGLMAKVEFSFSPDGGISGSRLASPSGNATMDESVMRAARSVRRISGVPAEFFLSHRRITVAFELTGGR